MLGADKYRRRIPAQWTINYVDTLKEINDGFIDHAARNSEESGRRRERC